MKKVAIVTVILHMTLLFAATNAHFMLQQFADDVDDQKGDSKDKGDLFNRTIDVEQFRDKIVTLCAEYIGGAWATVQPNQVNLRQLR